MLTYDYLIMLMGFKFFCGFEKRNCDLRYLETKYNKKIDWLGSLLKSPILPSSANCQLQLAEISLFPALPHPPGHPAGHPGKSCLANQSAVAQHIKIY